MEQSHCSDSFVLRIWWEEEGWRGWVQHATSGESRYFVRLADLLAFLEAYTGPLEQAPGVESEGRSLKKGSSPTLLGVVGVSGTGGGDGDDQCQ
ncbi:MAG: hypothetical protein Q9O62_09270 [Ardenticatenia bacterium]|nr:hypothetical protein [Ardenticatenia bacterium]